MTQASGAANPARTQATSGQSDGAETLRSYGGEGGDARIARRRAALVDAALVLLGGDDGGVISVRGVCREAGLTARYFYESFASVDDLVAATFDEVINEISVSGLEAFERGVDVEQKVAGAVGAIVDVIDADRRKGRLLFSQSLLSPTVAAKRMESTELFAGLTLQTASGVLDVETGPDALAAAHFQVGGLARVLAAWLDGHLDLDRDMVVEVSVALMISLGEGLSRAHASRAGEPGGR